MFLQGDDGFPEEFFFLKTSFFFRTQRRISSFFSRIFPILHFVTKGKNQFNNFIELIRYGSINLTG